MRRRPIFSLALVIFTAATIILAQTETPQAPQTAPSPAQPTPQTPAPSLPQGVTPTPAPPPPPAKILAVVVIDPAHGGADQGARGAGIAESDVVLSFARLLRISVEAQGLRVTLTRQANEDPSFDDRSKQANGQRGAVFISLHVASTGQPGAVRVYCYPQSSAALNAGISPHSGLISWDRAQFNFVGQSRRLAELIQIQMAQRFRGSPDTPFEAPVRQLRTVAAPAVAIEVSSVSVPNRAPLDQMGPGLADGVARAVAAFRTVYQAGGN